jgi:hypothetical protein
MGTIQNDGYAVVGGIMIFAAGMSVGRLVNERRNGKTKK